MQLVVRVERAHRPTETDVCATAARAVVLLLDDARCQPGGPWAAAVERWRRGRIRKVVRRARAHAWERAQAVDGVTLTGVASAGEDRPQRRVPADDEASADPRAAPAAPEVRAIVPGPTDAVPLEIARLQVRGLDLDDPYRSTLADAAAVRPGVVVALAPIEAFSTGKKAAAAGHAAQLAAEAMAIGRREAWAHAGYPVVCIQPETERWERLRARAAIVVSDAGFTEVAPGTVTAIAQWV
jgi:peptidyl-tRNA hydrolase